MKKLVLHTGIHRFSLNDLEHLQDCSIESLASLSKALVNITDPVILHGCGVVKSGNNYTVSAGAIYHNGEIYQVNAHALNTPSTPEWCVVTSWGSGNPIAYGSGSSYNVHQIDTIELKVDSGIALWNEIRKVEWVLRNKLTTTGKVEMYRVALSDFDDGLGKPYTEWEGWAICNGDNGTIDMGEFFPMGMKDGVNNVGDTGGAKEVTLTADQSGFPGSEITFVAQNGGSSTAQVPGIVYGNPDGSNDQTLEKTGIINDIEPMDASEAHENLPPYKVLRFIEKL